MPSPGSTPPPFVRLAGHPVRWQVLGVLADGDHRVRELATLVGEPQNLVSYHLRLLRGTGLVTSRRSSHDARDAYYHLDLDRCGELLAQAGDALHPALRPIAPSRPATPSDRAGRTRVLFACTGNTARSPVAEALLRLRAGDAVEVTSAGSDPGRRIHPSAVRVLATDYGIDLAGRRPRHLDDLAGRRFDYVITLCDRVREVCPGFADHPRHQHWSIPDPAPAGTPTRAADAALRRTARDIDTRIGHLLHVLATPVHDGTATRDRSH
jgi:protein-tyrosine-phosphatase/DNA-binding transcriptional ArsR family regulator